MLINWEYSLSHSSLSTIAVAEEPLATKDGDRGDLKNQADAVVASSLNNQEPLSGYAAAIEEDKSINQDIDPMEKWVTETI